MTIINSSTGRDLCAGIPPDQRGHEASFCIHDALSHRHGLPPHLVGPAVPRQRDHNLSGSSNIAVNKRGDDSEDTLASRQPPQGSYPEVLMGSMRIGNGRLILMGILVETRPASGDLSM